MSVDSGTHKRILTCDELSVGGEGREGARGPRGDRDDYRRKEGAGGDFEPKFRGGFGM